MFAPVVETTRLTDDIVRLVFEAPQIAAGDQPGQFVAIRAGQTDAPLLRRPFSIGGCDERGRIEIVFRIIGVGTQLLAARRPGETLDVIGPLGRPFEIGPDARDLHSCSQAQDARPARAGVICLVAGGLGAPPIVFLARTLRSLGIPAVLYYGVRTKSELALLGNVENEVQRLVVSTDDGTAGHRGVISEVVAREIGDDASIYACGPRPLLEALICLARERNLPAQLSFEQQMACGVGACMGCSIETARGYQRVCTEGPVFPAEIFFAPQKTNQ
ncbi:MAG: dihydroorotate dehydrogenase electron transfer subunit [Candidatus Sumerlaeia bacterium]|nr:dihydroorotate dehydrogenase electron transfer subunit [Candidatus Sumerlaeia bacterium]